MTKILQTINNKIKEHKDIIEEIDFTQEDLQKSLAKAKQDVSLGKKQNFLKLVALKERVQFHKIAINVLEDLKNDIEKV